MTRMFQGREIQAVFPLDAPFLFNDRQAHTPPSTLSIQNRLDLDQGHLLLDIRNDGPDEVVFHLYDGLASSPQAHRYRLKAGKALSLSWPANPYDLHIVAPDGLYRRFAGRLSDDGTTSARLVPPRRGVGLILALTSAEAAWFCVTDESGRRVARRSRVRTDDRPHLRVPVQPDGWYDLTVSRVGGAFRRRFAGRLPLRQETAASTRFIQAVCIGGLGQATQPSDLFSDPAQPIRSRTVPLRLLSVPKASEP